MFDIEMFVHVVSIAMFFVLIVTQAWRHSITTAIYVTSLIAAVECYNMCCKEAAFMVILFGAFLSLVRAIVNHDVDRILKRN